MTVETFIKKLQAQYKFYHSPVFFEEALPVVDFVYTKEMGFLLFAEDEQTNIVTPHSLLVDLHKVYNKQDTVMVIVDNKSYPIKDINSFKYDPDDVGIVNITC